MKLIFEVVCIRKKKKITRWRLLAFLFWDFSLCFGPDHAVLTLSFSLPKHDRKWRGHTVVGEVTHEEWRGNVMFVY